MFQSSPGRKAGRFTPIVSATLMVSLFQSSPGRKAGRFGVRYDLTGTSYKFQSSPGRKAGRFRRIGSDRTRNFVSILTRPQGRALLADMSNPTA